MATPRPIEKEEFSALMEGLRLEPGDGPFAVAVSGGPDSMALALLFSEFAPAHFLTFDHGLRPDSAREVKKVKTWLEEKGLDHTVLKWRGKKPKTGVQAAARAARYQALEGWCKDHMVKYLVIAHHLEDQAETVLMRLLKGSGIDGLVAMSVKGPGLSDQGIILLRPLLNISKDRLKATLRARDQKWIEDPSNENLDFTRVKIRKLLQNTDTLDVEALAGMAARLAKVKGFLDDLTGDLLAKTFQIFPAGYGVLDLTKFMKAAPEVGHRALSKILVFISQNAYPPHKDKGERLLQALSGKNFKGATLHGCRLSPYQNQSILVCREARDASETLPLRPGEEGLWDNRFRVSLEKGESPLIVKALGDNNWQRLAKDYPEIKDAEIPHPARAGLPAFFLIEDPVLVPHLGFSQGDFKGRADFKPKTPIFR